MNTDDPKLTAYALGELDEHERASLERELANSPEAQRYVYQTQQLARKLEHEFRAENHGANGRRDILPLPYARLFWSERRWQTLAIAALLVTAFAIAAIVLWRSAGPIGTRVIQRQNDSSDSVTLEYEPADEATVPEFFDGEADRAFVSASAKPISTFPTRVGTNSYVSVRNLVDRGVRPPKSAIRIEELINHFHYNYREAAPGEIASVTIDASSCPWAAGHQLVRIGVKPRGDSAEPLPQMVEVEFNPDRVESYRLIGYDGSVVNSSGETEGRQPASKPTRQSVTALYEIVPMGSQGDSIGAAKPLLITRMRSSGHLQANEAPSGTVPSFEDASDDLRFAAAAAEFGLILRNSRYKGSADLMMVADWAEGAAGANSERASLARCARKAHSLL